MDTLGSAFLHGITSRDTCTWPMR